MEFKKKMKPEQGYPVYEMTFDDDEAGIRLISLVDDPAVELKGMYFSKDIKDFKFSFNKEQKRIVGPALIPNKKMFREDPEGDYYAIFTIDGIKKAVRKFASKGTNRRINFNHSNQMVDGFIEQSWIVEDSNYDKSRYYGIDVPKGTYMIEVVIEDDAFWNNYVKEKEFYGFSVEGLMGTKLVKMSKEEEINIDNLNENDIIELLNHKLFN